MRSEGAMAIAETVSEGLPILKVKASGSIIIQTWLTLHAYRHMELSEFAYKLIL